MGNTSCVDSQTPNAGNRIVVVGAGMVSHCFVQEMVRRHPDLEKDGFQITVLGEEPYAAYDRVRLIDLFSGATPEALSLVEAGFYDRAGLTLHLSTHVSDIDRANRRVLLQNGQAIPYDQLVLATGSTPRVPPIAGSDRKQCFVVRAIEDLQAIKAGAAHARSAAVIGGGVLGLECAKGLHDLNLQTTIVGSAAHLMDHQLDEAGGRMLQRRIEALGFKVLTGTMTLKIIDGQDACHRLIFADATCLEADLIVFAVGVRPRDALARKSGLAVGPHGGIVIDDYCVSSDPAVYAIGECACWNGQLFGLLAPGNAMARVLAARLCGDKDAVFSGSSIATKLKVLDVEVASLDNVYGLGSDSRSLYYGNELEQTYKKIVVSADGKKLLGAELVGNAQEFSMLQLIRHNGIALPADPESLIFPVITPGTETTGTQDIPDSAIVCACKNVSKGEIVSAISAGAHTIEAIKSATAAGTICGGCLPLVTQLMESLLALSGIVVSRRLCEHFAYSRQELLHLIRVQEIHSFATLLERHGEGQGLGCDICRPTVASLLASCWNDFVLDKELAPLQDCNDAFLANIQKDGTYSVVPRIPAGEISPDGLMVIARVARKYGLYTKITGSQRIDMFGARLEQLPLIWQELVEAGFESGQAYGRSIRAVKSCVGSSWCRVGVQDSVSLAIEMENRYKGLRSPHKIKLGVSGCIRECAEARGKDVGVIATKRGWNLYVGGNGGTKPRHAELLASDLKKSELIKLVDRFLMFYIRTANRQQRTSTWISKLEGGIKYLQDVLIRDSLGLCRELEAQMQYQVDSFVDEWKRVVINPEVRKRFRTYVNTDARDENIQFVPMRGQIRPATEQEKQQAAEAAGNRAVAKPSPDTATQGSWQPVCPLEDIWPGTGVGALLHGRSIAVFRLPGDRLYSLDNYDPESRANVISRSMPCNIHGELMVATPIYKQHYRLDNGQCVEDEERHLQTYPVEVRDGMVYVCA